MKALFLFIFLILINSSILRAQSFHPNELRKQIYEMIVEEIKKTNPTYLKKIIWVDPSISVFSSVDLAANGIQLSSPINRFDTDFCSYIPFANCVDKEEINQFKLIKIFNQHIDRENTDFYGIYPPLDNWRNVVLQALEISVLKDSPMDKEVIIPLKHVYFVQEKVITEHIFYRFIIDNQFKIKQFDNIKFL